MIFISFLRPGPTEEKLQKQVLSLVSEGSHTNTLRKLRGQVEDNGQSSNQLLQDLIMLIRLMD